MITVSVLICLITLTSQLVHSKVITINITSGNSSHDCCTEEGCMCASLSIALQYIDSNSTINITSSFVMLEESVKLGSGNLTNITITGNNVTIMCNNGGSIYCESCDDVLIEGITWDRCGDPNGTAIAGVTFNGTSNISLVKCTFQYSQISAVTLLDVSENVSVHHCNFLSNELPPYRSFGYCGVLNIFYCDSNLIYLNISDSYFHRNCHVSHCDLTTASILNVQGIAVWNVFITKTKFVSNYVNVIDFSVSGNVSIQLRELDVNNNCNGTLLEFESVVHSDICNPVLLDTKRLNIVEILIINSTFTNNHNGYVSLAPSTSVVLITLVDVEISYNNPGGTLLITFLNSYHNTFYNYMATVNLTRVNVTSNKYGGRVAIEFSGSNEDKCVKFEECKFFNNTGNSNHGTASYILNKGDNTGNTRTTIVILNSQIDHNYGNYSVIYVNNVDITVKSSNFTDNVASAIYLVNSTLNCTGTVIFANNFADNGGAIYIDQRSQIFAETAKLRFINNSATEYGGAIYINLWYYCRNIFNNYDVMFLFVNNTARISGNSLYFYIPKHCIIETNISVNGSLLYTPCQFNYCQLVNGKMLHIPCDLDYTLLNDTGAPIVTSPHELRLYFPSNNGCNISSTSDHNVYFIKNNVLGYPVKFTGNVFDYFGKPAQPTQFDVQCVNCSSSIVLHNTLLLVDNISSFSINFTGENVKNKMNISVKLTSIVYLIQEINTTLIVELIPCIDHPGYTYSTAHNHCVCYHHNVDCQGSYNEIKRGYWFGHVSNTATTAPCHHYCKFIGRTETRQGYFELPSTIDSQCNDNRVGRACGECSSGYTLSYDSTDCISVDRCGAGWTVLVITLTCLYWITIVASVFALMYFKFQISLGYLCGLIYYYSIIGILLDNNPNLSDIVFHFVSVLSNFAQLTPQFLGKFCFVKDLSGIDQLFIHYSHAVGVSLLLLLIVVAARWSARVTLFVSRCIIRVICLLILLSYTSIVSTSLQLLQPLRFTDVKEWYTYTSPNIQYFHGRHAVYGVVAIFCELVVGIGLPLLLLLQPFLSRKINFIRIKPLLDQFQGCYKDKYRWFAAYYLICRQVIIVIVYSFNSNYYNVIFYLQTACVIIASIHMWIQPYKSALLNGSDGVVLLLMIQANSFVFVEDSTFLIVGMIIVSLPLVLFATVFIRKCIHSCRKKGRHYRYVNIDNADADDGEAAEENITRR